MENKHTFRVLSVPLSFAIAISMACYAGIDIDNPSGNPKYAPSSSIAAKGNTYAGVDVLVKIMKSDVTYDEELVAPGNQSVDWNHDFTAPSGGWPLGTDWSCKVWDAADTDGDPVESEVFRVSTM